MGMNSKDAASGLAILVMFAVMGLWLVLIWLKQRFSRPFSLNVIATGFVCIGTAGMGGAIIGPVLEGAKPKARLASCMSNIKQIQLGVLQYAVDYDELPPAAHWASQASLYVKQSQSEGLWHCPEAHSPYSYAFNRALSGLPMKQIAEPARTVGVFESDATVWNASGGKTERSEPPRHNVFEIHSFLDGHAKSFKFSLTGPDVIWKPAPTVKDNKP